MIDNRNYKREAQLDAFVEWMSAKKLAESTCMHYAAIASTLIKAGVETEEDFKSLGRSREWSYNTRRNYVQGWRAWVKFQLDTEAGREPFPTVYPGLDEVLRGTLGYRRARRGIKALEFLYEAVGNGPELYEPDAVQAAWRKIPDYLRQPGAAAWGVFATYNRTQMGVPETLPALEALPADFSAFALSALAFLVENCKVGAKSLAALCWEQLELDDDVWTVTEGPMYGRVFDAGAGVALTYLRRRGQIGAVVSTAAQSGLPAGTHAIEGLVRHANKDIYTEVSSAGNWWAENWIDIDSGTGKVRDKWAEKEAREAAEVDIEPLPRPVIPPIPGVE